MKRLISLAIATLLASPFALPLAANAADQIKIGMPMILSGPGALFGEPTLKGAQMFVDEVNAQGMLLQRMTAAGTGNFGYIEKRLTLYGPPPR